MHGGARVVTMPDIVRLPSVRCGYVVWHTDDPTAGDVADEAASLVYRRAYDGHWWCARCASTECLHVAMAREYDAAERRRG
jgi:hypothetical protein